jgi:signal transduction histidine kinase/Flp pilus assembly protein TadD
MTISEVQKILENAWQLQEFGDFHQAEQLCNSILEEFHQLYSTLDTEATQTLRFIQPEAIRILGWIAIQRGNYPLALEHLHSALHHIETTDNHFLSARIFGNLGVLHKELNNIQLALEYYEKALEINTRLDNKKGMERDLGNIGIIYAQLSDSNRTLEYIHRALAISQEIGDKIATARHLGNIGNVYAQAEDYERALSYFQEAAEMSEQAGVKSGLAGNLANIGNIYYCLNDYPNAILFLLKSLDINEEVGAKKQNINVLHSLAIVYEQTESWKEANEFNKRYQLLNNEIFSEEVKKLSDKLIYERKIAEREKELAIEQTRTEEIIRQKQILEEQAANIQLKNTELNEKNIELNILNRQLEDANNFKMKILGIASHDLKNPIAGIMLAAETIIRYKLSDDERKNKLLMMLILSKRMLDIIINLIDIAGRELGQIKLNYSSFDLTELTADVLKDYKPIADEKKQILHYSTEGNTHINADKQRIRQVLDNLVSNAIKYSEHSKTITVTLVGLPNNLVISVNDQGQGLSDEDKLLLFKDFQKLSAQPTAGEGSTGLGLSVVKHLVELHGGKVWAESEGKAKGSTFTVELPLILL